MRRSLLSRSGALVARALTLIGAVIGVLAGVAGAASLPVGWAPGGVPSRPSSQELADKQHMPAWCGPNSVLLFRVRGSGEEYPHEGYTDALGGWTANAGRALIARGYNVRDMQAIYSAPAVPFSVRPSTWEHYRSVATQEAPLVEGQLVRAYNRCKHRLVLLAGYSQGNIILREVVPHLFPALLRQIRGIDLVADPTADKRSDGHLADAGQWPMRATNEGLDTVSGRAVHGGYFRQTRYPSNVASVTHQYCVPYDVVCDASGYNLSPPNLIAEGPRHRSYPFAAIGTAAGQSLPDLSTPPPPRYRWACKPGENFSIGPGYFVTHSPWRIAMTYKTQLAIWRALPDGEFNTPHGGSSVPDTLCRVAASVIDDALVSWGETTTNDIVLPNDQVKGYLPGPRLGRFSCSGTTQHPTHTNFEITHESCVDRSGRFGFVGVKFMISGSP